MLGYEVAKALILYKMAGLESGGWGVMGGGGGGGILACYTGKNEREEVGTGKRGRRPESVIKCAGKDERRGRILERVT